MHRHAIADVLEMVSRFAPFTYIVIIISNRAHTLDENHNWADPCQIRQVDFLLTRTICQHLYFPKAFGDLEAMQP